MKQMLTNNYYALLKALVYGYGTAPGVNGIGIDGTSYQITFSAVSPRNVFIMQSLFPTSINAGSEVYIPAYIGKPASASSAGVYFGSGSTPPTKDDYTLENIITSGCKIETKNMERTVENNIIMVKTRYVISNTGSDNIIIGEVGIYGTTIVNGTSNTVANFLMERTVLDEPVVIPVGGVGAVEYTLTYTLPSAPTT
jgi:hypothetical protein